MKNIKVSIATRKDIGAVFITLDGKQIGKRIDKIKDEHILTSHYLTLIYTFSLSLRMLKQIIYNIPNEEIQVLFEVNNTTFIQWVQQGYSKDAYNDEFIQMMEELNSLPIRYKLIYQVRTFAYPYTHDKFVTKEKISDLVSVSAKQEDTVNDSEGAMVFIPANKLSGLDEFLAEG